MAAELNKAVRLIAKTILIINSSLGLGIPVRSLQAGSLEALSYWGLGDLVVSRDGATVRLVAQISE